MSKEDYKATYVAISDNLELTSDLGFARKPRVHILCNTFAAAFTLFSEGKVDIIYKKSETGGLELIGLREWKAVGHVFTRSLRRAV